MVGQKFYDTTKMKPVALKGNQSLKFIRLFHLQANEGNEDIDEDMSSLGHLVKIAKAMSDVNDAAFGNELDTTNVFFNHNDVTTIMTKWEAHLRQLIYL